MNWPAIALLAELVVAVSALLIWWRWIASTMARRPKFEGSALTGTARVLSVVHEDGVKAIGRALPPRTGWRQLQLRVEVPGRDPYTAYVAGRFPAGLYRDGLRRGPRMKLDDLRPFRQGGYWVVAVEVDSADPQRIRIDFTQPIKPWTDSQDQPRHSVGSVSTAPGAAPIGETSPPPVVRPTPMAPSERKSWIVAGVVAVVIAITGVAAIVVAARNTAQTYQLRWDRERQLALPFNGLKDPHGVAVDRVGNVYVTDIGTNRVLELAAGSSTQTVLPFTGLNLSGGVGNQSTGGVAVDAGSNVYLTDTGNNRVLELAAGSSTQTVLPFTGLDFPTGLAVDADGAVYVVDQNHGRVLKLAARSSTQTVLPSTGGAGPTDVAVDTAGTVYANVYPSCGRRCSANYLARLAAGSDGWTTLAPARDQGYVAVDTAGNAYVIASASSPGEGAVMRSAPGSGNCSPGPYVHCWAELPGAYRFTTPGGLAVDTRGNVYVTDTLGGLLHPGEDQGLVVKLPEG